jgi:drug/metabolite transporter (DMT)-like permease
MKNTFFFIFLATLYLLIYTLLAFNEVYISLVYLMFFVSPFVVISLAYYILLHSPYDGKELHAEEEWAYCDKKELVSIAVKEQ